MIDSFRALKPPLCHKEPQEIIGGFGCLELVLYGIRELAQHHYELLGNDLDIEWSTLL